jgi:hypothetical protein
VFHDNAAIGVYAAQGGAVSSGGDVHIADTVFLDNAVQGASPDGDAEVYGADLYAEDAVLERVRFEGSLALLEGGGDIYGGSVDLGDDARVVDASWTGAVAACVSLDYCDVEGGVIATGRRARLTGLRVHGTRVDLEAPEVDVEGGVFEAYGGSTGEVGGLTDVVVTDTRLDLVAPTSARVTGGLVDVGGPGRNRFPIDGLVGHGVTVVASTPAGTLQGGALDTLRSDEDVGIDLRDVDIQGFASVEGGAYRARMRERGTLSGLVFAGVQVSGADTVTGGAIHVEPAGDFIATGRVELAEVDLGGADIVDVGVGAASVLGAAIHVEADGRVAVVDTNLVDITSTDASATAVSVVTSGTGTLSHSNAYGLGVGLSQGVGTPSAMLGVDPQYTDRRSVLAAEWVLTLQPDSPCVAAGSGGADIGALGVH